jgi:hypothetical protein
MWITPTNFRGRRSITRSNAYSGSMQKDAGALADKGLSARSYFLSLAYSTETLSARVMMQFAFSSHR